MEVADEQEQAKHDYMKVVEWQVVDVLLEVK